MIIAYIKDFPYTAEALERREKRLCELEEFLRHSPNKEMQKFLDIQRQQKIKYVEPT